MVLFDLGILFRDRIMAVVSRVVAEILRPVRPEWGSVPDRSVQEKIKYYDNVIDATKAYNKKAIELHGEFARLNNV